MSERQAVTRTGRPPIGPEVKTRLTEDEIGRIEQLAAANGIDRSEWIRRAVRRELGRVTRVEWLDPAPSTDYVDDNRR